VSINYWLNIKENASDYDPDIMFVWPKIKKNCNGELQL